MIASVRRDRTRLGAIDYGLMALGNCFATYSACMAVGAPEAASFFVEAIIVGTGISLLVRLLMAQRGIVKIDAWLYAGATIAAVFFAPQLNQLLPGDGIPADVTTAGWLCWMISFGSALTWRDRTLLFQAVPTIALFGLVGCYDTFAPVPFLFFGFLLCLATLLGRSHSREMLLQAVESGYFNRADAPNAPTEFPDQSPELYEDIKKGPWRWLAGPEWALLSGLGIVLVSMLGAPVIRVAVQPISGAIKVFGPRQHRFQTPSITQSTAPMRTDYEVGRGPLFQASSKPIPIFTARMDHIRYLRTAAYDVYNGHDWSSSIVINDPQDVDSPDVMAVKQMKQLHYYGMTIEPLTPSNTIPLPAETLPQGLDKVLTICQGGGGQLSTFRSDEIRLQAVESGATPETAAHSIPKFADLTAQGDVVAGVRAFALAATKGAHTDYEKARLIQGAIERTCGYTLNPSAVPDGEDAADYFLNKSKQGYCDLFATSMVMCARANGIASRYVVGYLPDPNNADANGNVRITDRDYHAWAELFFNDVGWVVFDATAGATNLDKAENNPLSGWWIAAAPGVLNVAVGVAVVFALFVWLRPRLKSIADRRTPRVELHRRYGTFAKALARASGRKRAPAETPDEYFDSVKGSLNGASDLGRVLNAQFVNALYGTAEPTEGELAAISTGLKQFKSAVSRSKTREGVG